MEYFRDPKNQILADMAYRLGMVSLQYKKMSLNQHDFSATLDVAILQNLLTNCKEYIDSIKRNSSEFAFFEKVIDADKVWGISKSDVQINTFPKELTLYGLLMHLRDSCSHPTNLDLSTDFPSTGYTTKKEGAFINYYVFVHSPDTRNNIPEPFRNREIAERHLNRIKSQGERKNLKIYEKADKFHIYYDGKPYTRIFRIDLTPSQIHEIVLELSNFLAQPIQENWNGKTFVRLVA